MSDSNRRQMPVPRAAMMMHHLHFLEEEADESSLEFNENCNQAWRAQFRHPAMASLGVGFEFVSPFSQRLNSSMSTQDEDTENRMIGNSSSRTYRVGPFLRMPPLEYLPYSFGSDDENLVQHLT